MNSYLYSVGLCVHTLLLTLIAFLKTFSPTMSASILSTFAPCRVNSRNVYVSIHSTLILNRTERLRLVQSVCSVPYCML